MRVVGLWLGALMVAFLIHSMMNFTLEMPVGRLMFVMLLAVAAVLAGESSKRTGCRGMVAGGREAAVAFSLPLRGWRFAVGAVVIGAVVGYHVGVAWERHRAEVLYKRAWEMRRVWEKSGAVSDRARPVVDAYLRTLAMDPGYVDVRSGLGSLLMEIGEYREALETWWEVLRGLQASEIWSQMAECYERLGQRAEAREAWAVFFRRRPAEAFSPRYGSVFRRLVREDPGFVDLVTR